MQVKTWLQRLTDESSLWFNAIKAEDDGDMTTAVSYYLKDADKCRKDKLPLREALSCSCAGTCLVKNGNVLQARSLFSKAGRIYSFYAKAVMPRSIREASWSLREAYENYVMANELETAKSIRLEFLGLASRVNPFSDVNEIESELELVNRKSDLIQTMAREEPLPAELQEVIDGYLKEQSSFNMIDEGSSTGLPNVIKSLDLSGGSSLVEKSIVS